MSSSAQFPSPPFVDGYCERLTKWGDGVIGRTRKFALRKANRIATTKIGQTVFVHEPVDQAVRRIAAEEAAAKANQSAAE